MGIAAAFMAIALCLAVGTLGAAVTELTAQKSRSATGLLQRSAFYALLLSIGFAVAAVRPK